MIESRLDQVNKDYEDLKDIVPKFLSDADALVRELKRQVQELERNEERHKEKIREYEDQVDKLQEENRSLRQYKKDYEEQKKVNDRNLPLLNDYSRQIDSLKQQNINLHEQCRNLEHDLTAFQQKEDQYVNQINQQNIERQHLLDQCEHQKNVELANQATKHKLYMSKAENDFNAAFKRLELEIKERNNQIDDQKEKIKRLQKEIKLMPFRHASIITQTVNKQTTNDLAFKNPIIIDAHQRTNPATAMRKAVVGSSISSSTSSSSSNPYSRRRGHSVDPFERNGKRPR